MIPAKPTNWTSAVEHAQSLESDQRRGSWIDPAAGKITVGEWSQDWLGALDVAPSTEDYDRSLLTNHVLPRWRATALTDVSNIKIGRPGACSPTSPTATAT